jgi:hypothetical protein
MKNTVRSNSASLGVASEFQNLEISNIGYLDNLQYALRVTGRQEPMLMALCQKYSYFQVDRNLWVLFHI